MASPNVTVAHQCNFEQLRDCSQVLSVTVAAFAFLALCLVLWGLRLLWSLVCLRRLSGDNDDGQHAQQRRTPSAVVIGLTVFEWSIALAVASKAFFVVGASMALLGFKAVVSSGFLAGQRWGAVSAMILFFEAAILPLSRYEAKIAKLRRFVPYLLIIPLGLIPTIVLRAYLGDRLADAYVLQRTAYATVATNPDAYTAAYAEFSSALTAFRDANYAASLTALFADLPVIAFILVARRYFKITIRDGLGPALFALRRKADQEREELESAMRAAASADAGADLVLVLVLRVPGDDRHARAGRDRGGAGPAAGDDPVDAVRTDGAAGSAGDHVLGFGGGDWGAARSADGDTGAYVAVHVGADLDHGIRLHSRSLDAVRILAAAAEQGQEAAASFPRQARVERVTVQDAPRKGLAKGHFLTSSPISPLFFSTGAGSRQSLLHTATRNCKEKNWLP